MNWPAFLQAARVRAVEETDAEGAVWDAELRRAVTRETGQGVSDSGEFLVRRASALASKGRFARLLPRLKPPAVPSWLAPLGWGVAFAVGWWLAALGQESEINLLSLPLIVILAWNAMVVVLSFWPGIHKTSGHEDGWRERLLARFARREEPQAQTEPLAASITARFSDLVRGLAWQRLACRLRAWLHVGAALLALGSISAMYARGWSKEYRAVWESTLLDESGATRFFRALFAPASIVTGQAIPLENLPGMRRHPGEPASAPGDALPWIHLYAATLALFVLVPRALLVLLETSRARAVQAGALRSSDWQSYIQRLRSLVEGAGAPALVLTHGLEHDAGSRDRWRHWAYLHWRDVGPLSLDAIPVGGEMEFVNAWLPTASRVMLVFNMATTPEVEVQRELVEALARKLANEDARRPGAALLLALDDADLRQRWAGFTDLPSRLADHAAAWYDVMDGAPAAWHEMVKPAMTAK